MKALRPAVALLALVTFTAAGVGRARADVIYTDRAAFLANVQPGFYLETFDSLPQGFLPSPLSFSGSGFSYTASAVGDFFNVGPPGDVWLSTNLQSAPIVFQFTSGNVTAVGGSFFLTNTPGDPTTGMLTVGLNDGTSVTLTNVPSDSFLGFISTSGFITSLTVTPISGGDIYATVNNFIIGQAVVVPEPNSLALFGIVVTAAGYLARRRRRPSVTTAT
jgi:hypothetical protein